jgi:hypothetical protein
MLANAFGSSPQQLIMQDSYDFSTAKRGKFHHPEAEFVLPSDLENLICSGELMPQNGQWKRPIGETPFSASKKRLTLTPAPEGSGYSDTALEHDQAFLDTH